MADSTAFARSPSTASVICQEIATHGNYAFAQTFPVATLGIEPSIVKHNVISKNTRYSRREQPESSPDVFCGEC
ncbi:hypothetical protein H6G76_35400 [Nostoc sp. FACHB-152]|uniref:hypothetical protein n=1 Tax=unclassified Nostoc TaxID=2593658 RepID=UPI001684ECFF|nr:MULTISPECIES: hypothetical protein [unclassified Nostoc]MBD2452299.1 hypothetical protein [Nostoc sp. FACHB-152]MBD2473263.1 hypothetical protein [Nostoc sp. FACHB-145]